MKIGPHRLIILLISFCLLAIMSIQAYWILNSYRQKKEAFQRDVYSATEYVSKKMQEQENIKSLHQSIVVEKEDTVLLSSSTNMIRIYTNSELKKEQSPDSVRKIGKPILHKKIRTISDTNFIQDAKIFKLNIDSELKWTDSAEIDLKSNGNEIKNLVDKMIIELQEKDSVDSKNIEHLIEKALQLKGLFLPFNYSYRKNLSSGASFVKQSENFSDKEAFFKYDLGAAKIIDRKEYLYLQFPEQQNYLFAAIKGSLILSAVFIGIIILIFYTTIRLLLKQKRITDMKNDFVNNMTHELKTPIATIGLAIDAFDNPLIKNNSEKFKEYQNILKEENAKLNTHVERVLQMAMMEKGELMLQKEKIDVVKLLQEVIQAFKLQLQNQQIHLNFIHSIDHLFLTADAEHLKAAFNNLIDNAIKYSPPQSTIEISVEEKNKDCLIRFKDQGIGVEASKQEKIFEKFYRVQSGNIHDVKGFGLGLAFVKSIIDAHDATISLHSEKNKGTEFNIHFKKDA